jgi:Spy/CpxP family protein refolding chaperone
MVKKLVMVAGVLAAVSVLGLFAVGTAFAQGPAPTPPTPWGHAWGGVVNGYSVMSDAITKLLGMTWQQIYDARAAGKTLSDIAKSKGISDQKVTDTMLASQKSAVGQAVKDKRITQAQADWVLARMKAMAPFALTNPFGPGRFPGGVGPWSVNPPTTTK